MGVLEDLATSLFVTVMLIFNEPADYKDILKHWKTLWMKPIK